MCIRDRHLINIVRKAMNGFVDEKKSPQEYIINYKEVNEIIYCIINCKQIYTINSNTMLNLFEVLEYGFCLLYTSVSNYNKDGLLKNKKINSIKNYNPYYEEQYSYDDNGKPTQIVVNNNGLSSYKEFEYQSSYPDRLTKEVDGRREVDYTYHDETGAMEMCIRDRVN